MTKRPLRPHRLEQCSCHGEELCRICGQIRLVEMWRAGSGNQIHHIVRAGSLGDPEGGPAKQADHRSANMPRPNDEWIRDRGASPTSGRRVRRRAGRRGERPAWGRGRRSHWHSIEEPSVLLYSRFEGAHPEPALLGHDALAGDDHGVNFRLRHTPDRWATRRPAAASVLRP